MVSIQPRISALAEWRLRSRLCAAVDATIATVTAGLIATVTVDNVASWPSNQVLLSHQELSDSIGVLLAPCWAWLILSGCLAANARDHGFQRSGDRNLLVAPEAPSEFPPWSPRARLAAIVAAVLCFAVNTIGTGFGVGKGEARILPGPRYEISTLSVNEAQWTPISAAQYQAWQASFIREDAFSSMCLAVFPVVASLALLELHRRWRYRPRQAG